MDKSLKEPTRWPNGKRPKKNEVKIEIHSRDLGYFSRTIAFGGGEFAGGDIEEAIARIMFTVGLWLSKPLAGDIPENHNARTVR